MIKKSLSGILSGLIVFSALVFVGAQFWENRSAVLEWHPASGEYVLLALGMIVYAANNVLLALAWFLLLRTYRQDNISLFECISLYARTQIAKYIPGNVFQFAGRHISARQLGVEHGAIAGATLYEVIGLLLTSSLLALSGLLVWGMTIERISATIIATAVVLMISFLILFNKCVSRIRVLRQVKLPAEKAIDVIKCLLPVYLLLFLFMIIAGGIFWSVVTTLSPTTELYHAGPIVTLFALSYIAGFITPGAPGGLGVREAVIVGSLSNYVPEAQCLLIAVFFRAVTTVGDFLFFLSSFLQMDRDKRSLFRRLGHPPENRV